MLKYTKFGRSIYAVGGNQVSATLMGLNVKRTKLMTYTLCSLLTSIGGICYCLNTMCGTTTQATGFTREQGDKTIMPFYFLLFWQILPVTE